MIFCLLNENAGHSPAASAVVVDETAGEAHFTITLDRPSTGIVSVNYARAASLMASVKSLLSKECAGMGGGSSDAAVTFIGLQRLYKRALPFEEIPGVLRTLGSDVPFFTLGGRAAGYGRGAADITAARTAGYRPSRTNRA